MKNRLVRSSLIAWSMTLLLSCGGGSDGGGFAPVGGSGTSSGGASGSPYSSATSVNRLWTSQDGSTSTDGSTSAGDSTSTDGPASGDGPASADGSSGSDGSTTTAAGGDDSGVGSGGTGVSTADAAGIGAVDGLGSIIVNSVRYNTDTATLKVEDAASLQIGMSVKVTGPVDAGFTSGTAKQVASAAELRGTLSAVDLGAGSFTVMGTTVTTDLGTVWADSSGLAALPADATVQVWGLPVTPGVVRATRVEQRPAASMPIVTGTVQDLNPLTRTFTLGSLTVNYSAAALAGEIDAATLANGTIVRVRAAGQALPGLIVATLVESWYTVPRANATTVQLTGVITDYATLGSFRVLGTAIDASSTLITGGPSDAIGNGVKVEVSGTMSNGVLVATKLKIRQIPGAGGPASFTLIGAVGAYNSPSNFRVRGQPVNAGGSGVVFVNGTAADLRNGAGVTVSGSQVLSGVLIAQQVRFD